MTTTDPVERASTPAALLPDDMLARFDERAPVYDRENRFFDEDFAELRAAGFLDVAIPADLGGGDVRLDGYVQLMRRLAYHAPATALGVNMHVYWTGVAADLMRAGDDSCRFVLDRAAAGDVLCALHGEAGNDMPLLLSTASAARVDGGWRISGHKIFGSLTPVWTLGGFHAMDTSDPAAPQIVHGFIPRGAAGVQIVDTWDTLGMRATQSQDTILDEVFVPDDLVALVCPTGFAGAGMFHVSVFAWALLGFAAVYLGAAQRAFDMTLEQLPRRTSIALTRSMAHHPEVQHNVAEMRMAYDAAEALLERTAADWATGVEHAGLAGAPRRHPSGRHQPRVRHRGPGPRSHRRCRGVQAQPHRAAVPRCAHGPVPPGQHAARARADRQALPGHRPRRSPTLGMSGHVVSGNRMTRSKLLAVIGVALLCAPVTPLPAGATTRDAAPEVSTLATFGSGLASGSTIGPDGGLYVTDPNAGSLLRVDRRSGEVATVATGLPPQVLGVGGAMDVAFVGRTAYVLVTLVGGDIIGGPHIGDATVGIYRLGRDGQFTVVADLGAWAVDHPPATDHFITTGVHYALQRYGRGFLVTDGHHNRVLQVGLDGSIEELVAFDNIVPTGLETIGPVVLMGRAGPLPHLPEDGRVLAFGPWSSTPTEIGAGARLLVDVELGPHLVLYALSQGQWDGVAEGSPAAPDTGRLVTVDRGGGMTAVVDAAGHEVVLDRPTSLEIVGGTAYVVGLDGTIVAIEHV